MANTTYSFKDVSFTITSGLVGQKQVVGEGIGSIKVTMTDELTSSEIGADGQVMTSKIESGRGSVTLEIQQTSSLNPWLHNWLNAHRNAASSEWTDTTITVVENFTNGIKTTATGVSPMKYPDSDDEQQGQRVSWAFAAQNITKTAA